jgi:adenylate kinase family enzyme
MIIGSCGSGKTALAIRLNEKLNLPVIHLDKEYWKPGWQKPPTEEWEEKQKELVLNPYWIIDGNYGGTFDIRLEKADTVIFLDYNRYICLYRIIKRWLKNIGKRREDMAEGCNEKIDFQFIRFVWRFPVDSRHKIITKLEKYKNLNKLIFKNPKETEIFCENFS